MKVNDILKLNIIDLDYQGLGIAKIAEFPIFVKNALLGEYVEAKITRVTKNLAFADTIKIINKSESRSNNICPYYYECGGCNIMHMTYDAQLDFKTKITKNTIKKISGLTPLVNNCMPNKNIYGYRNKIIMPLGIKDNKIISGFYQEGSHNLVEIDKCAIEPDISSQIIKSIKDMLEEYQIEIYNETLHQGLIRNVMMRVNSKNEVMVVLVVLKEFSKLQDIVQRLVCLYNSIKSVYININDKKTNVVLQQTYKLLYGDKYLI